MQTLTRANSKVTINPIVWTASNNRVYKRTWYAALELRDGSEGQVIECAHTRGGHPTVEQAITCGKKLWATLD